MQKRHLLLSLLAFVGLCAVEAIAARQHNEVRKTSNPSASAPKNYLQLEKLCPPQASWKMTIGVLSNVIQANEMRRAHPTLNQFSDELKTLLVKEMADAKASTYKIVPGDIEILPSKLPNLVQLEVDLPQSPQKLHMAYYVNPNSGEYTILPRVAADDNSIPRPFCNVENQKDVLADRKVETSPKRSSSPGRKEFFTPTESPSKTEEVKTAKVPETKSKVVVPTKAIATRIMASSAHQDYQEKSPQPEVLVKSDSKSKKVAPKMAATPAKEKSKISTKTEVPKVEKSLVAKGSSQSASRNSDVRVARTVDSNEINRRFKGTKLAGQGEEIIRLAQQNGIDPAFFAAVIAFETGWGTNKALRNYNNPGGLMQASNSKRHQQFGSVKQGLAAMAEYLKNRYVDRGLVTVASIARVYCPPGASNDPKNTNSQWPGTVADIMNRIIRSSI